MNQMICLQEDGSVGGVPRSFFEDFGASQAGLQKTGMLCWMTADRISWHWVRPCAISQRARPPEWRGEAPRVFWREQRKKKSESNPFAILSFFKSPSPPCFSPLPCSTATQLATFRPRHQPLILHRSAMPERGRISKTEDFSWSQGLCPESQTTTARDPSKPAPTNSTP